MGISGRLREGGTPGIATGLVWNRPRDDGLPPG